jgi:hypothetical protein
MAEFNASFFERGMDIIPLINQGDANTDITSDWIKMRDYNRLLVVIAKYGSEDVDTLGFQFLQATSNGGTGKGINVSRYWTKQGTLTSQTVWTAGTLTTPDDIVGIGSAAPTGGTLIVGTDVNTSPCIVAVDIQASDFDADNGYDWFALQVEGDEVDNACLISAWAILMGGRFPQLVPLSAIS